MTANALALDGHERRRARPRRLHEDARGLAGRPGLALGGQINPVAVRSPERRPGADGVERHFGARRPPLFVAGDAAEDVAAALAQRNRQRARRPRSSARSTRRSALRGAPTCRTSRVECVLVSTHCSRRIDTVTGTPARAVPGVIDGDHSDRAALAGVEEHRRPLEANVDGRRMHRHLRAIRDVLTRDAFDVTFEHESLRGIGASLGRMLDGQAAVDPERLGLLTGRAGAGTGTLGSGRGR